ncbi:acyl-CoA thioesterase [Dyella sp. LX-66]|uniref:acyl-CoA thioesterase n=1 Tax=unclassified Dyella TaxID=2634549 RepID=UPI001BE08E2C|nr:MULTISPECIES: thioesterase family protein [unclassified Dyella]MBT2118930.1 acyl-CoA thioesterase [Dyella sp. LX-1]MBT2140076.1 acyl-CoA thioesterase [Dyella sp. LX-66]
MNLWFRLFRLLIGSLFKSRLGTPLQASAMHFRVLPTDIDLNLHMTNSRYWSVFDLGRIDLLLRAGLARVMLKEAWVPIIGTASIQFRRELRPLCNYKLETRLVGWEGTRWVIEHRVLRGVEGAVVTRALLIAGMYDRRNRRFIPAAEALGRVFDGNLDSPPLSEAANALISADAALKSE